MNEDRVQGPFSRKRALWLAGFGVATLVLTMLGAALGPSELAEKSPYADSFSKSAVGHAALVAVLNELDIPAERSRFKTVERAAKASLLVVAEPRLGAMGRMAMGPEQPDPKALLRQLLAADAPVLMVLPKWEVGESFDVVGHVDTVGELPRSEVAEVLEVAGVSGEVRIAETADCSGAMIMNLQLRDVQLIVDSDLHPLVRCGEGILVGQLDPDAAMSERRVFISDPDVIATHGLKHGGAQLAIALIQDMRRSDSAVIFDELVHGYQQAPSVYREAMTFPLALVTFHVLIAIVFVIWATIGRFGAPLGPTSQDRGRALLIDQEAGLLRGGLSAVESLVRYRHIIQGKVRAALGAPRNQSFKDAHYWLLEAAQRRGQRQTMDQIDAQVKRLEALATTSPRRVKTRDVIAVTDSLNRWKSEMLNG